MQWSDFKAMPEDLRIEYLRKLNTRFNVSSIRLAIMFGISDETARQAMVTAGIHRKRGQTMSQNEVSAWEFWLNDVATNDHELNTEEITALHDSKLEDPAEVGTLVEEPETVQPIKDVPVLKNGKLFFDGDTTEVADAIHAFLTQTSQRCKVTVKFEYA